MNPFDLNPIVWGVYSLVTVILMVLSMGFGFLHAKEKKYYDKGKLAWGKSDARIALAAILIGPMTAWLWPIVLVVVPSLMGIMRTKALLRNAQISELGPDYLAGIAAYDKMRQSNATMALELEASAAKYDWVKAPNGSKKFRASTGHVITPKYSSSYDSWGYFKGQEYDYE